MIAYLEPVTHCGPTVALERAVVGFRRREGVMPEWATPGEGVDLPSDALARLGLRWQPGSDVRPGHVLVGKSGEATVPI